MKNRGTKIIVEIPRKNFNDVFSNTFNWSLINIYDVFSDKFQDIYVHKIEQYIRKEFYAINILQTNIMGTKFTNRKNVNIFETDTDIDTLPVQRTSDMYAYIDDINEQNHQAFVIHENSGIGSTIRMEFFNKLLYDGQEFIDNYIETQCLVRGIPVKESIQNYFIVKYFRVIIDFQSPNSDKLLTLSRDKFIPKLRDKYYRIFIDKLLPEIIKVCIGLFEKKYGNSIDENNEEVALQYLHLEMTAQMTKTNIDLNSLDSIYKDFKFPASYVTKFDQSDLFFKDLFSINSVLFVSKQYKDGINVNNETMQQAYNEITGGGPTVLK